MAKIRGTHSSPGVYTKTTDLSYAAESYGISSLGLVGETLMGPAFEPMLISSWTQYKTYFGGTSTEKFKNTLYPRYEAPYIAKAYLEASDKLYMCKVLGLSGYNAGKSWHIKANTGEVICVLRSRAKYSTTGVTGCTGDLGADQTVFACTGVSNLSGITYNTSDNTCGTNDYGDFTVDDNGIKTDMHTLGSFKFVASANTNVYGKTSMEYVVSLDSNNPNYILNVIGTNPLDYEKGPLYVEAFYDNLLRKLYDEEVANNRVDGSDKNSTHALIDTTVTNITDESAKHYKDAYRNAKTPWFVSNIVGVGDKRQCKRLFRLHTISDGNSSNRLFKVTISNVRPDEFTFDIIVRDLYDTDRYPVVLEHHKNLTMIQDSSRFIGYVLGTIDGEYEIKSKYIAAELINSDEVENCVPCGFMGYPTDAGSTNTSKSAVYNTKFNTNIKTRYQYFGFSDRVGIDIDLMSYKGHEAYKNEEKTGKKDETFNDSFNYDSDYATGYTRGFHLDQRVQYKYSGSSHSELSDIIVDGFKTTGFETPEVVNDNTNELPQTLVMDINPDSEVGTIYADVKTRKFTALFYGGFDGWDIFRGQRSNGDTFKFINYKGLYRDDAVSGNTSVEDYTLENISDVAYKYSLEGNCNNSDYYAFLSAINQFESVEKYKINLLATPGIDYINNKELVDEVIYMLEEVRQDAFYVVTTPDKPSGATDQVHDMFSPEEIRDAVEDNGIDTYYASTYYPWVRYHDTELNKYIYLPPTKDVLRNMANVDNKKYPWYAPAGIERGSVDCVKMKYFTKLADEDTIYDTRVNPLKAFHNDGVKVWGNKTLYSADTPMNRINVVRLVLYMRKLIIDSCNGLIFEPNDSTLQDEFKSIINPILTQIKADRGIADFRLKVSQTVEQMDAHEMSAELWIKPTPTLEYLEINFVVTPLGVDFED